MNYWARSQMRKDKRNEVFATRLHWQIRLAQDHGLLKKVAGERDHYKQKYEEITELAGGMCRHHLLADLEIIKHDSRSPFIRWAIDNRPIRMSIIGRMPVEMQAQFHHSLLDWMHFAFTESDVPYRFIRFKCQTRDEKFYYQMSDEAFSIMRDPKLHRQFVQRAAEMLTMAIREYYA